MMQSGHKLAKSSGDLLVRTPSRNGQQDDSLLSTTEAYNLSIPLNAYRSLKAQFVNIKEIKAA